MSLRVPIAMEIYRRALMGDRGDRYNCCFEIPNRGLRIILSNGAGWDHVSVSLKDRCPTWDEMEWVKRTFFEDGDTVMQLHVPIAEHINTHPYCLHLWRPHGENIPRPPAFMVG